MNASKVVRHVIIEFKRARRRRRWWSDDGRSRWQLVGAFAPARTPPPAERSRVVDRAAPDAAPVDALNLQEAFRLGEGLLKVLENALGQRWTADACHGHSRTTAARRIRWPARPRPRVAVPWLHVRGVRQPQASSGNPASPAIPQLHPSGRSADRAARTHRDSAASSLPQPSAHCSDRRAAMPSTARRRQGCRHDRTLAVATLQPSLLPAARYALWHCWHACNFPTSCGDSQLNVR